MQDIAFSSLALSLVHWQLSLSRETRNSHVYQIAPLSCALNLRFGLFFIVILFC